MIRKISVVSHGNYDGMNVEKVLTKIGPHSQEGEMIEELKSKLGLNRDELDKNLSITTEEFKIQDSFEDFLVIDSIEGDSVLYMKVPLSIDDAEKLMDLSKAPYWYDVTHLEDLIRAVGGEFKYLNNIYW